MKKKLISFSLAVFFLMIASFSFSQSWEKTKPFTLYAVDKDKNVNTMKVGIGTATPNYSLEVKGKIFTDSLHVLKQIEVGNSIWISGGIYGFTPSIFSDLGDLLIHPVILVLALVVSFPTTLHGVCCI